MTGTRKKNHGTNLKLLFATGPAVGTSLVAVLHLKLLGSQEEFLPVHQHPPMLNFLLQVGAKPQHAIKPARAQMLSDSMEDRWTDSCSFNCGRRHAGII